MIQDYIKSFKDFPVDGVDYKDIASLCASVEGFKLANDFMYREAYEVGPSKVVGLDARGFPFAAILSDMLQVPLILARKSGKLPGPVITQPYSLEYGTASIEIQSNVIDCLDEVVIVDDLIATGGTMNATIDIIEGLGAKVAKVLCVIDLPYLNGSTIIKDRGIEIASATMYNKAGHYL